MTVKNAHQVEPRLDLQRLTFKHFLALKFANGKHSAVRIEEKLTQIKAEIFAALEAVEPQYQKKFWTGIVKSAPSDKRLKSIFNVALALSHSQGMYDGLRDGWRLHKFSLDLERDPRKRLIVAYLREQKSRPTDRQICAHLDRILKIPQQGLERDLRTIVRTIRENPNRTVEELANLLYADIMDLNARRERPTPLPRWKTKTWTDALTSTATRNRVSKYLSDACKIANGRDCGFLEVWEKLGEDRNRQPRRIHP
jgi:hypothetical protein